MTATATLEKPASPNFKSHSEKTLNNNVSDFMKKNFPKVEGSTWNKIIHLWNNNFRINYYRYEQNDVNVLRFPISVESYFLEVYNDEGNTLKIKNHTLIDREIAKGKANIFQG